MNQIKIFNELIRLKKITGTLLLIFPCLFSIAHLSKFNTDLNSYEIAKITLLFICGAFFMRSAGCIINDLSDKNFDRQVQRTKNRPLASKQISSKSAIIILGILLFLALLILVQFNRATILSGILAMALVILYPLMKRITYYPQLFLGITFNFGIIMASLAMTSQINIASIILYCACIAWTLLYDTIYGFQDIEDDMKIGIKSSSIKFSQQLNPKRILYKISAISGLLLLMFGVIEEFNKFYFLIITLNSLLMIMEIRRCNLKEPHHCLRFFKLNNLFGALILTAIIIG